MNTYLYCPQCGTPLKSFIQSGTDRKMCGNCNWVHYHNPTVGVAVILLISGSVLLTLRKDNKWCVPCGHVEWDESIESAAKREFYEETQLIAGELHLFSAHSNFHDPARHTVGIWFLADDAKGGLKAADDALEARFYSLHNLPELSFPTDKIVLADLHMAVQNNQIGQYIGRSREQDAVSIPGYCIAAADGSTTHSSTIIDQLKESARKLANSLQLRLHVEDSCSSEAAYLSVNRGCHWFGLRIATHPPAYACSADFQQLLIPEYVKNTLSQKYFHDWIESFIKCAGSVVADPHETATEINRLFTNSRKTRHPTTREICDLRYRLNQRAKWAYDIEIAGY